MYKIASENAQRRRDALVPRNLVGGDEKQTDEDRRRNLVRVLQALDLRIQAEKNAAVRKSLGCEKFDLQNQISALRPKRKGPEGIPEHFVEAARAMLTPATFKILMNDAANRARAAAEVAP